MIHTTNPSQNRLERTSKRKFTLWNQVQKTINRIVIIKLNRSDSNAEKKSENTNFNITNILKNISMEYKQQKFEGAFKPHKCQMPNGKYKKKLKKRKRNYNKNSNK